MNNEEFLRNVEWFCYFLLKDLEMDEKTVEVFGEETVRAVCMKLVVERIDRFCENHNLGIERIRRFMAQHIDNAEESNEQTDDFDGNPLTVV